MFMQLYHAMRQRGIPRPNCNKINSTSSLISRMTIPTLGLANRKHRIFIKSKKGMRICPTSPPPPRSPRLRLGNQRTQPEVDGLARRVGCNLSICDITDTGNPRRRDRIRATRVMFDSYAAARRKEKREEKKRSLHAHRGIFFMAAHWPVYAPYCFQTSAGVLNLLAPAAAYPFSHCPRRRSRVHVVEKDWRRRRWSSFNAGLAGVAVQGVPRH